MVDDDAAVVPVLQKLTPFKWQELKYMFDASKDMF